MEGPNRDGARACSPMDIHLLVDSVKTVAAEATDKNPLVFARSRCDAMRQTMVFILRDAPIMSMESGIYTNGKKRK